MHGSLSRIIIAMASTGSIGAVLQELERAALSPIAQLEDVVDEKPPVDADLHAQVGSSALFGECVEQPRRVGRHGGNGEREGEQGTALTISS